MPTPSQTFTTIQQLLNYINANFITNGRNEITAEEGNNILNSLATFIQTYTLNNSLAKIWAQTSGEVNMTAPINIFTAVPGSVRWTDNVQHEFYMVNATGVNIPLSGGFSYVDAFNTTQTVIPARSAIHIAKTTSATWVQINNLGGNGGGGLPPTTGHSGQSLSNNGTTTEWADMVVFIQNTTAGWQVDGVTYLFPGGAVDYKFMLFFDTLAGWIYQEDGQWEYVLDGSSNIIGFKIDVAGINANTQQVRIHLYKKGLNS